MKKFSTIAFRSFKIFIGELTSVAAGIYVGVQEALPSINGLDSTDPWNIVAKKHEIVLNGLKSERVLGSAIRLNLVSLYSGFDLFVSDIRCQFYELHGKEWQQHDGDAPFVALKRNTPSSHPDHEERLGKGRIASMDYYRLVRNAIAHPKDEATAAAKRYYLENKVLLSEVAAVYGMKSAPNQIDALNFHDIKYLARLALDLASAVDQDFDPGDVRLATFIPTHFFGLPKSQKRIDNACIGWLKEKYGVKQDRAERILSLHKGSLAQR